MPTVKIKTFNYQRAKKNGFKAGLKLALLYGLIELRSKVKVYDRKEGFLIDPAAGTALWAADALVMDKNGDWWFKAVHTEIQYSDTYGGLSFSATTVDKTACCRLKKILYSHDAERWDTVELQVTEEQERLMFAEACRLADVTPFCMEAWIKTGWITDKQVFHGPKAAKYDKAGVFLSNIHPARIIGGSTTDVWCTESVCMVTNAGGLTNLVPDMQIPAQFHIRMLKKALAVLPSRERTGE